MCKFYLPKKGDKLYHATDFRDVPQKVTVKEVENYISGKYNHVFIRYEETDTNWQPGFFKISKWSFDYE